jgi:hypothetical protein
MGQVREGKPLETWISTDSRHDSRPSLRRSKSHDSGRAEGSRRIKGRPRTTARRRGARRPSIERGLVKRGRCRFCVMGLPHIPLAVGFGRSGPTQTRPRTDGCATRNTSSQPEPEGESSPASLRKRFQPGPIQRPWMNVGSLQVLVSLWDNASCVLQLAKSDSIWILC